MSEEHKDITPERIEKAMEEIGMKEKMPYIKKHEWEEDGVHYHNWEINTGKSVAWTNDAGLELFDKAMKNWIYNDKTTKG